MTLSINHGLVAKTTWTESEIGEVEALAQACNDLEGIHIVLNTERMHTQADTVLSDFLYYHAGTPVGYVGIENFGGAEAEITGMVHPNARRRGLARELLQAAQQACQARGMPRILAVADQRSGSGRAFLQAVGAVYRFSEHSLTLQGEPLACKPNPQLELRKASAADIPLIAHILTRSFNDPAELALEAVHRRFASGEPRAFYLAYLAGQPIGTINVFRGESGSYMAGFGVLPEWQGKGHGRQILASSIHTLRAVSIQPIAIEVETENAHALGLYLSCGFKTTATYDYYALQGLSASRL